MKKTNGSQLSLHCKASEGMRAEKKCLPSTLLVEEKRKKKMRANATNDDDRRRFPSLGGGNDDEGTCFPRVSPHIINSKKNGLHSGDDDSSSAFFYLVRVWGPRKGEKKMKKKDSHFCHLPHHGDCNRTSGRLPTTQESLSSKAAAMGCEQRREKKKKRVDFNAGNDGGSCFHRVGPKGITAAHCIYKAPKGQHKGTECEQKKKKKKRRVDFVLTMEQQRSSGTHSPRKRPYSL
jgi:hypothetical protein